MGGKLDAVDFSLEKKIKECDFWFKEKKVLYLGRLMFQKAEPLARLLIICFLIQIKNCSAKEKIGFLGNFSPDLDSLFGEITGRYLISTQNKDEVQRYLKKQKRLMKFLELLTIAGF